MKIMNLYHQISNPLDSDENLMKVVDAYCSGSSFYNAITRTVTKNTPSKISGRYSRQDANQFYVLLFECWKKNLIKLYQKNRIMPEYKADCLKTIRFLEKFHPTTREEVTEFLLGNSIPDPDVKKFVDLTRWDRCGEFSGWDHIDSSYIFLGSKRDYEVEHRLYINCDSNVLHRLMNKFIKKCLERKVKFYFKYDEGSYRDDAMVIYCDTKHLPCFINILREIAQEDEIIRKSSHAPTILSGAIDGWIGYGSEPELLPNGDNTSFNVKRTEHLQACMDKQVFSYALKNQNRTIQLSNGKNVLYKDYLIESIVYDKIEQLSKTLKYCKDPKKSLGYDEKDLHSQKFYRILKNVVVNNYSTIMSSMGTEKSFSFQVPFENAAYIYLGKSSVEKALRNQLKFFLKEPAFKQKLKTAIRESSKEVGIDPNNYAFDLRAVKQFKALDKAMEASATKQTKTPTVPPRATQPKQNRRSQYRPMTDAEILASRRKINASSTVPPKATQPKQNRRSQYTPMTDAEILASRRKINASLTVPPKATRPKQNRRGQYTPMTDAEILASRRKINASSTVPPKATQPKQNRRGQYTPMTDAEILASRRKLEATPLATSSSIKSMHINREHSYTEPYHLRNKGTKSGMFDYNLEKGNPNQYKK